MLEPDFTYILQSDPAHVLIVLSILVVVFVVWTKRRLMKYLERRNYFKRLKAGSGIVQGADKPTQLEFDF